jgi:hypothetical protein
MERRLGLLSFLRRYSHLLLSYWLFCINIHTIGSYEQTLTKEEQIRKLEEELKQLDAKKYSKTSDAYGSGNNLEAYPLKHLNIQKNPDLMPCPRRPPKKSDK